MSPLRGKLLDLLGRASHIAVLALESSLAPSPPLTLSPLIIFVTLSQLIFLSHSRTITFGLVSRIALLNILTLSCLVSHLSASGFVSLPGTRRLVAPQEKYFEI